MDLLGFQYAFFFFNRKERGNWPFENLKLWVHNLCGLSFLSKNGKKGLLRLVQSHYFRAVFQDNSFHMKAFKFIVEELIPSLWNTIHPYYSLVKYGGVLSPSEKLWRGIGSCFVLAWASLSPVSHGWLFKSFCCSFTLITPFKVNWASHQSP